MDLFIFIIVLLICPTSTTNCSSTDAVKCVGRTCDCHMGATSSSNISLSCLSPICNCTPNGHHRFSARCKASSLRVQGFISHPENVLTLDLSGSGATFVSNNTFSGFCNLVNLSLAQNNIHFVKDQGFQGLSKLQFLDLSLNDIQWWEGDLGNHTPSLRSIDLTGNNKWKPGKELLKLSMLREIRGITWSQSCQNCSLTKEFTHDTVKMSKGNYIIHGGWCRGLKYSIGKSIKEYATYNFSSQCLYKSDTCYNSEIKVTKIHRCWDTDNSVLNLVYVFGILEIVLNSIVVILTFSTKCLRENVTMLFIANLALSDLLVGLYGISIAISRRVLSYVEFDSKVLGSFCLVLGSIWVVGEFVTVVTSVLLTFERYIAIQYCLVPNKRINRRKGVIYLVIAWVLAVVVAALPLVGIGSYSTNTFCVPIQPSRKVPSTFAYSVGLTLLAVVLYLITTILYTRIYLYVRNSGSQVGIKRDGVLAKRIALIVFSNMVFFFFPTINGLLWMLTPAFNNLSVTTREVLMGSLPVVLFTVNSFVNPLLYAYRNERFRQVLRHAFLPKQSYAIYSMIPSRTTRRNAGHERQNNLIYLTPVLKLENREVIEKVSVL